MTDIKKEFHDYWPEFLESVQTPVLRNIHLIATALALYFVLRFLVDLEILSLIAAPVLHTGIVFAAHNIVENNKPLQFKNPLLASMAEFRMLALWCGGVLEQETQNALSNKKAEKTGNKNNKNKSDNTQTTKKADSKSSKKSKNTKNTQSKKSSTSSKKDGPQKGGPKKDEK